MKYRYLRDPLFLLCAFTYIVNRWLLKPFMPNTFSQCYLNDLICIPFWVPIMVFGMRHLGFRDNDLPPTSCEIVVPLILWSAVFEIWLPCFGLFKGLAIPDHVDIFFYTLGALLAVTFWNIWYKEETPNQRIQRRTRIRASSHLGILLAIKPRK